MSFCLFFMSFMSAVFYLCPPALSEETRCLDHGPEVLAWVGRDTVIRDNVAYSLLGLEPRTGGFRLPNEVPYLMSQISGTPAVGSESRVPLAGPAHSSVEFCHYRT